jgi:hypothetical protein
MTKRILSLFLILAFGFSAFGQQAKPAENAEAGLGRLRADIGYLASDPLDGRRTGTAGADAAAQYISKEFKRVGLKPAANSAHATANGYGQEFPYIAGVGLGKTNRLAAANAGSAAAELKPGEEWMPLGFSANINLSNLAAVFVKHGITAKELNHDDYANLDLTGKIAVAWEGTPDGENPHGQFASYDGARWKAIAAKDHGAAALIILSSEKNFGDDKYARMSYDNAGEAGVPVLVLSRAAWTRLAPPGEASTGADPGGLAKLNWTVQVDVQRNNAPARNVVGVLEGSDTQLKNEVIILGAHYDHLGRGGEGSLAPRSGEIHHGADDNASGVAGLLELARTFTAHRKEIRRTIVFIAFSGEEEGLIGSSYYVNHPLLPLTQTVAMINMDMIGRLKDGKLTVGGVGTSPDFNSLLTSTNIVKELVKKGEGGAPDEYMAHDQFNLALSEDGYGPSDHSMFYSKQIPVLFFFTNSHEDYHKPSDTADKINYEGELNIIRFVETVVRKLDANQERPVYTVAKSSSPGGRSTGFRVYLGTIPNYADTDQGLLLDGVRDDSPASKAGLQAGDRIVKIAGRDVKNVYDYTYALGEMKAGEAYEVEIIRGGQRLKLQLVPAARK